MRRRLNTAAAAWALAAAPLAALAAPPSMLPPAGRMPNPAAAPGMAPPGAMPGALPPGAAPANWPPNAAPAAWPPNVPRPGAWSRDQWVRQVERQSVPVFVRLASPSGAAFTFYGQAGAPIPVPAGVPLGLRSRNRYLFQVTNLGGDAKRTFHGSVEVLRGPRLKAGMAAAEAPAPIALTDQDEFALLRGGMVTKVIVLERPDQAMPVPTAPGETIAYEGIAGKPEMKQAEQYGRPMLVVRLGDRVPAESELVGDPAALLLPTEAALQGLRQGQKPKPADYVTAARAPSGLVQASFRDGRMKGNGCVAANGAAGNGAEACESCGDAAGSACGSCGRPGCADCARRAPGCAPQFSLPPIAPWSLGFLPMPGPAAPKGQHDLLPDDEYLCDGGDRGLKAHHDAYGRLINLGSGDTVLTYRDGLGELRTKPSTTACVYAPRYVEVRFQQGAEAFERVLGAQTEIRRVGSLAIHGLRGADEGRRVDATEDLAGRTRVSGMEGRVRGTDFSEIRFLAAVDTTTVFRAVRNSVGPQKVEGRAKPQIVATRDLAKILANGRQAQLFATGLGYGEVRSSFVAIESRSVEPGPGKPAKAIVEKSVDVEAAQPGDTVTFTIRCRNVGTEPLRNAALVDQLPARLDYVPKSAQASRDATFSAEGNEFGSNTLRWELKADLPGGSEFEVKFKALVR